MPKDREGFWTTECSLSKPTPGSENQYVKDNALLLTSMCLATGTYSMYGVAGLLATASMECSLNPALIESGSDIYHGGAGLVQWTPAYTHLISFCENWGVDWKLVSSQLRKLELERTTPDYDIKQYFPTMHRTEYVAYIGKEPIPTMTKLLNCEPSEYSALELAASWVTGYTRPDSWANTDNWERNARWIAHWYEYISGHPLPPTPTPTGKKKKHSIIFMLGRRRK